MAEPTFNDAVFALPSWLFIEDEVFVEKQKPRIAHGGRTEFETGQFSFPDEFSYGFDLLGSSSVGESSENDETSDDEEDFLAGLTRRLTHSTQNKATSRLMTSSPQSTLNGMVGCSASSDGSPDGPSRVASPPTTPFREKDEMRDLIYEAAGKIATLQIASEPSIKSNRSPLLTCRVDPPPSVVESANSLSTSGPSLRNSVAKPNQQIRQGRRGLYQSSWPPPPQQQPPPLYSWAEVVSRGVSGPKRQCTGTGVFLPHRDGNTRDSSKKSVSGRSTILIPAKVIQALNLHNVKTNGYFDYDSLMARRDARWSQQKRSLRSVGETRVAEVSLPMEWIY